MTYTTPTLIVVGAAQNLVLEGSPVDINKNPASGCQTLFEDPSGEEYNETASW